MRHPHVALLSFALAAALVTAPPTPAADAPPTRTFQGRVVNAADGKPVAGAEVSLLERSAVSDAKGRFTFTEVPIRRTTPLNVRILDWRDEPVGCKTLSIPVAFYPVAASAGPLTAVVIASAERSEPLTLELHPVEPEQVAEFCAGCHKPNPCLQTLEYGEGGERPKALGGIGVHEEDLAALEERLRTHPMDREAFRGLRYQDAHPQGLELAEVLRDEEHAGRFQLPANLALQGGSQVTCDTCHTRHQPGVDVPFLVMEFQEENTLCMQCHL